MAKKKAAKVEMLRVDNPANSDCSFPLSFLDFSNWFLDGAFNERTGARESTYLQVRRPAVEGSYVSVFCKKADNPRIACDGQHLYWLLD